MKHGKKFTDATKRYDREHLHDPVEALDLVKNLAPAKFDETVEAAFKLGVDPRKADQMLRGTVSLPKGTGKTIRVAVFAQGVPTWSVPRTSSPVSRVVSWTSTSPLRLPTSWVRSASSVGRSDRAA